MGWLQLAAGKQNFTVSIDEALRHIEAARLAFAETHHDMDGVLLRRCAKRRKLRAAHHQTVVVIALDELHSPDRRVEKDEPGKPGDPRLGKRD